MQLIEGSVLRTKDQEKQEGGKKNEKENFVFALLLMMVSLPAAFAAEPVSFTRTYITGGSSQVVSQSRCERKEPNSMDVHITYLNFNGQEEFRFSGYDADTGNRCTNIMEIFKSGYRGAKYTSASTTYAYMKMSIKSSNTNDKLYFNGKYAI